MFVRHSIRKQDALFAALRCRVPATSAGLRLGLIGLAVAAAGCADSGELATASNNASLSAPGTEAEPPPPPITVAAEPAGANCTYGGAAITDAAGTTYVCNGTPGAAGAAGADGVNGADGADGAPGADGVDGIDGVNGVNGAPGADGTPGVDGADGVSVTVAAEAAGGNCDSGGVSVTGANGTAYVCDGTDSDPAQYEALAARVLELEKLHYSTRVFVTSSAYAPDFGGIAGGDGLCQAHADAAGLGGVWFAWLSDSSSGSPAQNFNQSPYNYVLVDGSVVAEGWEDLTDGALTTRITLDENGTSQSSYVWTGTATDGSQYGSHCSDWSSTDGYAKVGHASQDNSGASPQWWSTRGNTTCSGTARLYCFEQ